MSKTKKFALVGVIIITSTLLAYDHTVGKNIEYKAPTASQTPTVTRQETVKQLIDDLQKARENDPTFKAETARLQKELDDRIASMRTALTNNRKAQSRLDALTIIQVQSDVELSELTK